MGGNENAQAPKAVIQSEAKNPDNASVEITLKSFS